MSESESAGGLGEASLLARIIPHFPQGPHTCVGPGDDAAVVEHPGQLVMTTDAIVQNHDFILGISDPLSIGRKAAIQNLADVAAMGARPLWLLVTVLADSHTPVDVLEGIAEGIGCEASKYGATVIGGDLGTAAELTISITAVGALATGHKPVLRSGAKAGDVLAVGSPILGLSSAGLAQVLARAKGSPLPIESLASDDSKPGQSLAERSLAWHLAPEPTIELGWKTGHLAHAMIDVSDGLVRDAGRIAEASGVTIDLDPLVLGQDAEVLRPLADLCSVDPMEWVLGSGEEHAMLAAFPADAWAMHARELVGFRTIGTVRSQDPAGAVLLNGQPPGVRGWDHFE